MVDAIAGNTCGKTATIGTYVMPHMCRLGTAGAAKGFDLAELQ